MSELKQEEIVHSASEPRGRRPVLRFWSEGHAPAWWAHARSHPWLPICDALRQVSGVFQCQNLVSRALHTGAGSLSKWKKVYSVLGTLATDWKNLVELSSVFTGLK